MKGKKMQLVSSTMASNIFTMGACEQSNPLQTIGNLYTVPNMKTRMLRAKLLLEECLETINAMGIEVIATETGELSMASPPNVLVRESGPVPVDIVKVIDGCTDLNYVSCGTLLSFGVPDVGHQEIVNVANMEKFPKGIAIMDSNGKYQKPEGWQDPYRKHQELLEISCLSLKNDFLFRHGGQWASSIEEDSSRSQVFSFFTPRECKGRKNG